MVLENITMTTDEDTQKGKYLTFELGNDAYGIAVEYVTEIIGVLPVTQVPELPDYIKGIMNLRGRIIPLMDVRLRFNKPFEAYNERTCIVVIEMGENAVGLAVDSVSDVLYFSDEDLLDQPLLASVPSNRFVKYVGKVGESVRLILDCEKLLTPTSHDKATHPHE